ncbi:PP2C family protein-serine/threonine phosphatase [Pararhodospirillum photometricum]|uniref:PP2C family protein-serine/threonine phosphatase n=1 Tax=Pararhodospirillum photometricum TaxID=1084 RepID=UPI0003175F54|nr:PP2C family protein-serine/threonine phosphatase [Pararhodospirillum photometricum]
MSVLADATSLLRYLPVGRRIFLVLLFYGIAMAVAVGAGGRILGLVDHHGTTAEALRHHLDTIARVREASGHYQTLYDTYAKTRVPLLGDDMAFQHLMLVRALDAVSLPGPDVAEALAALRHAVDDAQTHQALLPPLNTRIEADHLALAQTLSEAQGLMALLQERFPDLPNHHNAFAVLESLRFDFKVYLRLSTGVQMQDILARLRHSLPLAVSRLPAADQHTVHLIDAHLADAEATLADLIDASRRWMQRSLFIDFISLPRLYRTTEALVSLARERDLAARRALESATRTVVITVAVVGAAVLLAGFLAVVVIARSLQRPLSELVEDIDALSQGAQNHVVRGTAAGDEVGIMARTVEAWQHNSRRLTALEMEKRAILAREKEETERALHRLDQAHAEIRALNDRLSQENLRLGAELDVSRRLQRMLLPRDEDLKAIPSLDIAAFMEPANEVGGDYYDVLTQADGTVRFGIGDVTGHGLESGVVMLLTQSAIRALTESGPTDLPTLITTLNRAVMASMRRLGSGKTVTLALIDHHPRSDGHPGGELVIAGQHESVIVRRTDGRLDDVDTLMLGMPLGLEDDIGAYLGQTTVLLDPGDMVVLYTDGITESVNAAGQLYGLERLHLTVQKHADGPARAVVQAVLDDVRAHQGDQVALDDVTLVVFKQRAAEENGREGAASPDPSVV